MKRLLVVIAAILVAMSAYAQGKIGVTAGMNFNAASVDGVKTESKAGWNVGVTYAVNLPFGFSVQPSLVYTQKNASFGVQNFGFFDDIVANDLVQSIGSLTLPVSVQWGPDLIVARPFVDVTPYVGYSLSNKLKAEAAGLSGEIDGKNSFEYGVGLGAGLNVWKLQAVVRYNWNFGTMGNLKDFTGINPGDLKKDSPNYGGVTVSVAFFF